MIYSDENGNPIQETDELQEAIDNITDKLAQMTKEERLAWFEQSIYPDPLKFTNEIDGTVYIVRAFFDETASESFEEKLQGEMDKLTAYRTKLQNKIRRDLPAEKKILREENAKVTEQITSLRKRLKLNKGIEDRSVKIEEKTTLLYANE